MVSAQAKYQSNKMKRVSPDDINMAVVKRAELVA
jgi:hypothetical protein